MENKEQIDSGREYGIDLFKAICMFMVVVLHVLGKGGVLNSAEIDSTNYWVAWFLEILSYGAVDGFAITTGYLMVNHTFKYRKIIPLWLTVSFYSLILLIVGLIFFPEAISWTDLRYVFPVTSAEYWYFTAYFLLFFFIPFLNKMITAITRKEHIIFLITGFLLFSIQSIIPLENDPFQIKGGYSAWWLIYLYVLGAGIKKYGLFTGMTVKKGFLLYILMSFITWGSKYVLANLAAAGIPMVSYACSKYSEYRWISYESPCVLFAAIFLMMACIRWDIPPFLQRILKGISPMIFQVYIIHLHKVVLYGFITDKFSTFAEYPVFGMIFMVVVASSIIFISCLGIDAVRVWLFKKIDVANKVDMIVGKCMAEYEKK